MGAPSSAVKISTYHNLLVGMVFLLAAVVIVILVNLSMKREALKEAEAKARLLLDRNLAIHTYFSHDLKPRLFSLTERSLSKDHFDPVWMSSTYAVRVIDGYTKDLGTRDYYYKECAVNARSPENEADSYERDFIEQVNRNKDLVQRAEVRDLDGNPYFVVMRRGEVLEQSCLRCHSEPLQAPGELVSTYGDTRSFFRIPGEIISAISIRIPLSIAYADANRFSLLLSCMLLGVLLIVFALKIWLSVRMIFSPLSRIRDKAIQIATDERFLGEEITIPAGKELDDLTRAFNQMSRKLRNDRDHLEELVKERTADLQTALDNVKTLRGMLPICASCKKIRNDGGYWSQIEVFIREHSDADFSHGICPDCAARLYPDYYRRKDKDRPELP